MAQNDNAGAAADATTRTALAERAELEEGPCEDRDPGAGEITDDDEVE